MSTASAAASSSSKNAREVYFSTLRSMAPSERLTRAIDRAESAQAIKPHTTPSHSAAKK